MLEITANVAMLKLCQTTVRQAACFPSSSAFCLAGVTKLFFVRADKIKGRRILKTILFFQPDLPLFSPKEALVHGLLKTTLFFTNFLPNLWRKYSSACTEQVP